MSRYVQDEAEERDSDTTTSTLTELSSTNSGETLGSSSSCGSSESSSTTASAHEDDMPIALFMAADDEPIEVEPTPQNADPDMSDRSSAAFTDGESRATDDESTASSQLSTYSLKRRGRLPLQVPRRSERIRALEQQRLTDAQARRERKRKQISDRRRRRFQLSDSEDETQTSPSTALKAQTGKQKSEDRPKRPRKDKKPSDVSHPKRQVPNTAAGRIETAFEIEWLEGRYKKVSSIQAD
ncbi:hypothetical protein A4X13_0g6850 [Tilletia indica]|uniref:Uncharacterized protein n=1 Tax=Tilletia indica TaxID=43049 RepID=A0A177TG81_9BASI|nr:hypothetical protein A4X13_0g6850 [Tilletia indica]